MTAPVPAGAGLGTLASRDIRGSQARLPSGEPFEWEILDRWYVFCSTPLNSLPVLAR